MRGLQVLFESDSSSRSVEGLGCRTVVGQDALLLPRTVQRCETC
jgi:hypothetical protein